MSSVIIMLLPQWKSKNKFDLDVLGLV